MGAPQHPGRSTEGPPPSDQQPSPRIAAAASMLRRGHDPDMVAAVTDVPFALVELIAEHLPPRAARLGRPDPPTADRRYENGGEATGGRGAGIVAADDPRNRQRRRIRILWIAMICAAGNAALGVVGVLTRWDTLAAVCLSLTPLTYIAVLLLLVLLPRPDSPPGGH